mgnify:FL=1|jgi:hypothetical protein
MAEGDFIWIYLVFFMIPLARVIPRLIRKWQNKNNPVSENQYKQDFQRPEQKQPQFERPESFERSESFEREHSFEKSDEKPLNQKMMVLGEINRGVKDFNQIQKITNIDNQKLENILKGFEDDGLMRVVKKDGIMGSKIEMHPTEKGYKKFTDER